MLKGAHIRYFFLKKLSRMGTLILFSRFSNNEIGQFGSAPSEIVRIVVEIIVAASFFGVVAFFCSFLLIFFWSFCIFRVSGFFCCFFKVGFHRVFLGSELVGSGTAVSS